MRVTVAICTYNRAEGLRDTLECLRHQVYDQFEVVVVNGPSTDHTAEVLAEYAGQIRTVDNPHRNLSISRNMGIRAAGGDIVAFIDDDALPEFRWLEQAIPAFDEPDVAGVGGIVFDHTGMDLQYRYSASNRFGQTEYRADEPYDELCRPGSAQVPYLQGTNCLFRREALARIGLFDETFDYYLDETDVCLRMVDAGYRLRQLADAPVHHKFLPSHVRNHERVVTNWFPVIKNMVYFGYRHALPEASELEVIERGCAFGRQFIADAAFHEERGGLPEGSRDRCELVVGEAITAGIDLGRERADLRLEWADLDPPPFLPFPTIVAEHPRKYVLVSSGYPPAITGGIARYVGEVAPALAARGHEVRVITKGVDGGAVDLEDGVWVHRIDVDADRNADGNGDADSNAADDERERGGALADGPDYVDSFASAVVGELDRMQAWTVPDLVYGPAWDVEVLGVARRFPVPVGIFLATPLDIVAEQSKLLDDPNSAPQIEILLELERELFSVADLAHADSNAVLESISERYGELIDDRRAGVALLGLADRERLEPPAMQATKFLFVGRLEPRKGIDTLLSAFAELVVDHPDVKLVVIGADGPMPRTALTYRQWFEETYEGEDVIDQVDFRGRTDDDELERWHEWADCLVLPSRYESFGLTMLHAMLSNRAVISCDVGAIPEVIRDEVDGLLTPVGDVGALRSAMERMIVEPGLARDLAVKGRMRFEQQFEIGLSAVQLENLFSRVSIDRSTQWFEVDGQADGTLDLRNDPDDAVVVLESGSAAKITNDGGSPVRTVIGLSDGETSITVDADAKRKTLTFADKQVVRLPVGSAAGARISLESGRLTLVGLVDVEPEGH